MFVSDNMENMKRQQKFELEPVKAKSDFPGLLRMSACVGLDCAALLDNSWEFE
jgi:hypothetical protein